MHHCWYRLASARVAEIHANSFIRTPYADVYSRQILASMVEEAWSGSIAKVDGSFQVISPSLCLGTCFSTGKCCFVHWKTATFFSLAVIGCLETNWTKLFLLASYYPLETDIILCGTFCTSLPLLASERLRSGDACYEVNMEALATLLLVLARWGLSARLVRETQAFSLPEFHKHDKKQTHLAIFVDYIALCSIFASLTACVYGREVRSWSTGLQVSGSNPAFCFFAASVL